MGQEPRKASEVLLEIESKVNILLDVVRSQDLVIKVLSNKLNDVINQLKQQQAGPPKIVVEAVQAPINAPAMPHSFTQLPVGEPERTIPIVSEANLPSTDTPKGFRRTSRPETFAGDDVYVRKENVPAPTQFQPPVQLPANFQQSRNQNAPPPGRSEADVFTAPTPAPSKRAGNVLAPPNPSGSPPMAMEQPAQGPYRTPGKPAQPEAGQIPVQQRIVDKNGKSIFLADVEITDLSTSMPIFKTRTNGTGKWMAALGIGAYQVKIGKRASNSKEKLEAVQDIQVDGSQVPLELPMLIIK